MRGVSYDVSMRHGRRMSSPRHQPREMRHVNEVERSHLVCDLPHAGKINDAWVSASAADDELWVLLFGQLLQLVVVNRLGFPGDSVRDDLVSLARKIQMMPVGEMPAMRQVQAQNRIARL